MHLLFGNSVSYFAMGDSHTAGLNGGTGGWRKFVRTVGPSTGPFIDTTGGRKHAGIGGNRLDQMEARFLQNWTGSVAPMVTVMGASNDIAQGATAADAQARFASLLQVITGTIGTERPVYVITPPTVNTSIDATVMQAQRKMQATVASARAAGKRVYMLDCGRFLTGTLGDLDGTGGGAGEHPIDGTYGEDSVGTGYGKFAAYFDRYFTPSRGKDPSQASLGTLQGWYRADNVIEAGGLVSQMTDLSGQARHLTGAGTQRTSLTGSGVMGQASLGFNGTSTVLRSPSGFSVLQPFSVWLVTGPAGNNSGALFESSGSTPRSTMFGSGVGNGLTINAGSSVTDTDLNPQTVGHAYFMHFNGVNSRLWVDGTERRLALSVGTNGVAGFALGATFVPGNFFAGQIMEMAVFSGSVSEPNIFDVFMYGAVRYNLWPITPLGRTSW